MSYENKLARARELIVKRDEIDAELVGMFSGVPVGKRGRPRKETINGQGDTGSVEAGEPQDIA